MAPSRPPNPPTPTLFTFFPHSLVFLLAHLFSLYATLCHPPPLAPSWQPINRAPTPLPSPLPTLMARLLALMHFKRTAAATSQSARLSQISTIFILSFIQSRPGSDVLLIMSARRRLSDSGHHHLQPEYAVDNASLIITFEGNDLKAPTFFTQLDGFFLSLYKIANVRNHKNIVLISLWNLLWMDIIQPVHHCQMFVNSSSTEKMGLNHKTCTHQFHRRWEGCRNNLLTQR